MVLTDGGNSWRSRSLRWGVATAAALMLSLSLFACNNTDAAKGGANGTTSSASSGGSGNTVTGDTIPVGVYASLTGDEANFGKDSREGAELAVDTINGGGGVNGKKIDLKIENDESDPSKAASAVTKLITSDKVVAVVGEVASGRSLAAAPICQQYKIPMVSPSSTNIKVTQIGDYIFRVCFIDPFQAYVMAKFSHDTLNAKNVALFIDSTSPYSRDLGTEFQKNFEQMGGKIVDQESYVPTDTDFKGQLTKLKTTNPDAIFAPGYYKSAGEIAKQAKELGIAAPMMGTDGWDAQDLFVTAGDSMEGSYFSDHMDITSQQPEVKSFVDAYKKKYGADKKPGSLTALGYDAVMILAQAMKNAKTLDGPGIRDALAQVKDFKAVTGDITINGDRNADKPAVVLQIKGRDFVYKTTIAQANKQ